MIAYKVWSEKYSNILLFVFLRAITKGFTFWKVIMFMPKSLKWAIIVQNALFMKNYIATFFYATISQC